MTLGIIIQARMGSTRLPGKVLEMIGDRPLLGHVILRLEGLKSPAVKVVATTVRPEDDAIEEYCDRIGVECFRGSAENVLERYYLCAVKHGFTDIVRMTSDNPFTDIEELDRLIELHKSSGADYTHSFGSLPIGTGAEVFTFEALKKSFENATGENHFEHVNEYIQERPDMFNISVLDVPSAKMAPELRLTVDTPEDLRRARFIAENSGGEVTTEKAIEICSRFA